MLHTVMAAAFEDVPEAHQVRLYVSSRVLDRVTHPRLSREVNYLLRLVLSEGGFHSSTVVQICFDELKSAARSFCGGFELSNSSPL